MRKLENYTPTRFMAADSTYNKQMADYAVNFIECLCHTKGTWAGKPFELIDWQEQIIRDYPLRLTQSTVSIFMVSYSMSYILNLTESSLML